jgi:hypothetical protein
MKAKTYEARQGLYEYKASQLEAEGDIEGARYYREIADRERIQNENKQRAGADARAASQPDLSRLNPRLAPQGSQLPQVPAMPRQGPAPEPGVSGAFDLGPNNERLNQTVRAIQSIKDPQERANAVAALEAQLNGARPPARQPAQQKPITSVADLKAMSPAYSNIPDAKLRELYKKKTGVDLK